MPMQCSNSGGSPKEHGKKSNLIPNNERSPEELQEMGRKGGIASGKARRKKRDLQKKAKLWMGVYDELERRDKDQVRKALNKLAKEIMKRG